MSIESTSRLWSIFVVHNKDEPDQGYWIRTTLAIPEAPKHSNGKQMIDWLQPWCPENHYIKHYAVIHKDTNMETINGQ